ncbi:MAG: protein kinase [Gemmatimonadaceae bacterium]
MGGLLVGPMSLDLLAQLQSTLGSAFTIERELGGGGMSRVFVATETALGRRVVIKVLPPELTAELSAERFRREIQLAAQLRHPLIVPLLSAGEAGGVLYYTMPLVEGESLRARLVREGALPVRDVVRLMRELADALAHAHSRGVVHRDIKPENVLLEGSHALVADFGVAKALSAATAGDSGTTAAARATATGVLLGTPAYMAPEQAAGDRTADHRADLYALGLVGYEMLAGRPPFAEHTPQRLLAAHLVEAPAPLARLRPDAPPALAELVMRCLEKDPARRPQSAAEVLAALEAARTPSGEQAIPRATPRRRRIRTAAGTVVALLLVAVALVAAYRTRPRAELERPVLAVLPFDNLGPAADAYFADGLTDEVRARLASVAGLRVIGGTSARLYKGSAKSPREIARELGATHLLTGTVRWDRTAGGGGRVRVSPELVRAADQATVWAEPVEGPLGDVFAMQARVAERVAAALDVALLGRGRGVNAPPPTTNLAAYDAYLRGLAHSAGPNRFSAPARRAAIEAFEQAVALDPRFAAAHARLAMAYLTEREFGYDSGGMVEKARASVTRAIALDSTLVESQLARGSYLNAIEDPDGAYRAVQAARRIAPGDAAVQMSLGLASENVGRLEEAVSHYRSAERLEPRWADPPGQLAGAYDRLYRHEEAIRAREREIALAPSPSLAWTRTSQAASYLLWRADTAAARRELEQADDPQLVDLLVRMPTPFFTGRAIWPSVMPRAVLLARDTITRAAYIRGDWGTPDLYHLMKARHFALTGRPERARAHADSAIALIEPALRRGPGTGVLLDLFTPQSTLAEAYAYAGRPADAARVIDQYVEARRRRPNKSALNLPYGLVTAAYVDVLIGRRDLAVARLDEALRLPSGQFVSRALLRADPSWAPLRGHPGFERLIAGG